MRARQPAPVQDGRPNDDDSFGNRFSGVLLSSQDDPNNADHQVEPQDILRASLGRH